MQAPFGAPASFLAGTHTFTNVMLKTAGNQAITATVAVATTIKGTSATIAVHT